MKDRELWRKMLGAAATSLVASLVSALVLSLFGDELEELLFSKLNIPVDICLGVFAVVWGICFVIFLLWILSKI